MRAPEKMLCCSIQCSISICETYLWLLTALLWVTFVSRVTTLSSLLLNQVTEITPASRQLLSQELVLYLFIQWA